MKCRTLVFLGVVTGFGSGCAILDKPGQQPLSTVPAAKPANPLATEGAKPKASLKPKHPLPQVSKNTTDLHDEEPDAVIKMDPRTGKLTGEMELRLQKVVEEAKQDDRILIRLESFVPGGGSPGLDLSRSEKSLKVVKDRLLGTGIPHRRILVSSFGAEHDRQRDPTQHWVEIYLIKAGPTSAQVPTYPTH